MHRIRLVRLTLLLAPLSFVVVTGCSGDAESRPAAADGALPAASPAGGGSADALELTLGGTRHAGTHRVSGTLGCMVFNGVWQASWESPEATGLSGMILRLKEIPPSGGSSTRLSFTAIFGSQVHPDAITTMVDVHGSEFGRDGRGTVSREGKGAVIRLEGTAQQGGRVTAVLRCASVDTMS